MRSLTVMLTASNFQKLTQLANEHVPPASPEVLAARLLTSAIEDLSETISEPAKPKTKT